MDHPPRIAALASGGGSNVGAIIDAIARGDLEAELALVVSNNSKAGVLERAREAGAKALHISSRTHPDPTAALLDALAASRIDVLVLAGYLKKLDPRVVAAFEGRATNIHPAPLPRFGGRGMFGSHVHAAVLAAGVAATGPTVHRVTAEYDEGETLGFTSVDVQPGDTVQSLSARVLAAEHDLYWRVLAEHFCSAAKSPTP